MREYRDFEEKSVEKAIERACSELGIDSGRLCYDIISHGSSGIFGLVGAKKAVIRVTLPEDQKNDYTATPASEADEGQGGKTASALVDEAFGTPVEDKDSGDAAAASDRVDDQTRLAIAGWVRGLIRRVVELISPDSEINEKDEGEIIRFEIQGGDSARLIGKRGQTLDAILYLVERGVYKQFGNSVPIEIDVEGYLEKRRSELTALAFRLAEKALQTGKPMVINRINSQDRRVVHLSLRDNRQVRTQSVGNGDLRKLLILPKKKQPARRSKNGDQ